MINITINTHESKHDCETCGGYSTSIYSLTGDLGNYVSGDEAYCFDSRDGSFSSVVDFIVNALKEKGFEITTPDFEEYTRLENEIDWDEYYDQIDNNPLWHDSDVIKHDEMEKEIERFYTFGWREQIKLCGVVLEQDYTEDEDEDWWDDDYDY